MNGTNEHEGREEKLPWTFERDTHSTAYHFYKHNDFKFKAGINNPEWLCDMLNECIPLREQLAKEQQDTTQAIDVLTTQIAKLIEQLVLERALRKELVEALTFVVEAHGTKVTTVLKELIEIRLHKSKLLDDKEVKKYDI